jgi:hypothetical protein
MSSSGLWWADGDDDDLAMRTTAEVTGGKPISVSSQSISGVSDL